MNRREALLAILAAANGQPFTPVQIQKAAFLIATNIGALVTQGPKFNFTPYDYGPFDRHVYSDAEALQMEGLALINNTGGRWRTYSATPAGVTRGNEILAQMPPEPRDYVTRVSEWVRSLDFATLVKSIYAAYPEMRANSVFQG